eukprot:4564098-Pyramimonas_sp.AAC.1
MELHRRPQRRCSPAFPSIHFGTPFALFVARGPSTKKAPVAVFARVPRTDFGTPLTRWVAP